MNKTIYNFKIKLKNFEKPLNATKNYLNLNAHAQSSCFSEAVSGTMS